ncbi:glycosyltransferase family 39 protein [Cantharellus anzutake]|uniref:glycosyltransferase family 39 protein n=1 Tax=Cantharellus anzutake TaxID=1750568 RepID=UPI001905B002|nr:glycosyltransferase family 39 protein [Cantharellus anzutake]KAF8337565.1 glycosyltransferase family 39 protein [Cantharellus anzutake]
MSLRRNIDSNTLPTANPVTLDVPLSRDSSYEEIPYGGGTYGSFPFRNHFPHTTQHTVGSDDERLPLHNMEAEPRRRNVAFDHSNLPHEGWVHGDSVPVYQPYSNDVDGGRAVYEKARIGYATGRLPPRQPKEKPHLVRPSIHLWAPFYYTLLGLFTRIHDIGLAPYVIWDEAHFGKFASHYLKREFYFDVHPPLGKMLVAFVGLISGYDGSFEFKSGDQYPSGLPYVAMRVYLALFGVAMIPLGWLTASELHFSYRARHLVTWMVLFDLAWLTISRFILLDSLLLCFTCTTVYFLTKFHNQQYRSFSFDWWLWLIMTGLSIGAVTSVKWVGMFATALVGLYTIEDLWDKFGDLRMPVRIYAKHWAARILCLIILPFMVYLTCFKIHFLILSQSGPGDSQMSSLFQANLEGNDFSRNPLEVAFGSRVTLKNVGYGGGLLHSHVQTFPVGSLQQQVTCYHYKDDNNNWDILPSWDEPRLDPNSSEIRFLLDGDTVRLQHGSTTRMLHSHAIPAPITKSDWEVSGYGNDTVGDVNDHWVVEVHSDLFQGKSSGSRVHSLTTRLRFRHKTLGCYLKANNVVLPGWGFKQTEVTCDKENNPDNPHTHWNVESHWNDHLPPGEAKQYHSPFLADFWHLNVAMMTSNNALVPDPDKFDILASTPDQWPWLKVGLRMCGWGDNQTKYYLIGNPIVWWGTTFSLILFVATFGIYMLRWQRKYNDLGPEEWQQLLHPGKIALYGWCLHYIPFLAMGRVTYIHHYLPTLWFAVLMGGHMLDHLVFSEKRRFTETTKSVLLFICGIAIFGTFWWFKGVSYGINGPVGEHKGIQWRNSWNIYN